MNRSILIVICDFLVLSVLSLTSGLGYFNAPISSDNSVFTEDKQILKILKNLHTAKIKLKQKENMIQDINAENRQLRYELSEKKKELEELLKRLKDKKVKLESLEKIRSSSEKTLKDIRSQLKSVLVKYERLKSLRVKQKANLAAAKEAAKSSSEKLKKAITELNVLKASSVRIKQALSTKEKELAALKSKLNKSEAKIALLQEKLLESEKKLSYTRGKLESVQKQLESTENKLAKTNKALSLSRLKLVSLKDKLSATQNLLASTTTKLYDTQLKLQNTDKKLIIAKKRLEKTEKEILKREAVLREISTRLKIKSLQVKKLEKKLTTDVFPTYEKSVLKLTFISSEKRWPNNFHLKKNYFLPQVILGNKNYFILNFDDFFDVDRTRNWLRQNRVYELKVLVSHTQKSSQRSNKQSEKKPIRLIGPILALAEDPRVCIFPITLHSKGDNAIYPITFEQLKKRGLRNIYLFKGTSFGKDSCNLGNRCSLNLNDGYLYIQNNREIGSENAAPGDFLMTKEGYFVGIVVAENKDKATGNNTAKCFVFPAKIDLGKSFIIPLIKKKSEKYYIDFVKSLHKINEHIININK